jgi:tetratricopeptide (TPR) repeat protein
MRILTVLAGVAALALLSGCVTPPPSETASGVYLSGRIASGLNDIGAAADHYALAAAAEPNNVDILREAFFYHLAAGRIDAAQPYAVRLAVGEKPDGFAALTLAAAHLKRGDLEAARAKLQGEFSEPFTNSVAYLAKAFIASELEGPDAGIEALSGGGEEIFKGFNPTFIAMFAEEAGRAELASQFHQMSVASFGGPIGRSAYGAFLERSGNEAAAREFYGKLAQDQGPPRRLAQAGLARLDRKTPSRAYTDVSAAQGAAMALYLFSGNILEQSAGERQRASAAGLQVGQPRYTLPLALAQLAVYLDPSFDEARRVAGAILSIYGENAEARAMLAAIAPSSPLYEQAQIDVALSQKAEGDAKGAIARLKSTVRRDQNAESARLVLAGLYADEELHTEAAAVAGEAIARLPDPPAADAWRFYITRAASLIEIDRWREAEVDLKRAVELAPEEATTLNYLGYSWAERGVNLEEAFKLIEKAVALEPTSGAIIDSLGWAHYQLGRYEEALPHLEKAAALEPADPTITDHLGDVYWRLGRTVEARFQWKRALELSSPDDNTAAIGKKLKDGLPPAAPAPGNP